MKKYRVVLIFILCFLVSGCSVKYELEFVNNKLYEKTSIINNDPNTWDIQESKTGYDNDLTDEVVTYKSQIYDALDQRMAALVTDELQVYDRLLIKNRKELGIKYSFTFSKNNFSASNIASSCYNNFNFISNDDIYMISTSEKFTCFNYDGLDDVTVHIKSNHKVIESNADEVDGEDLYWYINKSNYENVPINVKFSKNEYVFNYDGKITKTIIIIGGIAIFAILAIIIFMTKAQRKNDI